MIGSARGCLRIFVVIGGLAILGFLWFTQGNELRSLWNELTGRPTEEHVMPSQALADHAQTKLAELRDGRAGTVAFSEVELQSLLMYEYQGLLPAFVDSPRIELDASRLVVKGRMPIDRLPDVEGMRQAAALLPDTTDLALTAQLVPLGDGRVALAVDEITVSRIPLPQRLYAPALSRLGRRAEPGLPADAVAVPLPPGVTNAYVRADSLVLVGRSANPGS